MFFAVVSLPTRNMNKFGTLLEKMDILHIYCTYHVLQITVKNAYLASWYSGAVYGIENDAEDFNMDEVGELFNMGKARSLVEYFSLSNQVFDNLKQQIIFMQYYSSC